MDSILSKTFSYLRFPLIVGVVLIHVNLSFKAGSYWFENISYFLSEILSRLCVPMFFIMSGYLFFSSSNFTVRAYISKVSSRIKSLMIPYLCWNTLALLGVFLVCYILGKIPATYSYSSWWSDLFENKSILQTINNSYWEPKIAYQFWFIRDLFIVVLFSPIVYLLIRHTKIIVIIALGILWYFNLNFIAIPSVASIFFFTLGAYIRLCAKEKVLSNFSSLISKLSLLYPVVAIVNIFLRNDYIHNLGIILGVIFVFNAISYFICKDRIHTNKYLTKASFFVFALHEPMLTIIKKIYVKLIPSTNSLMPILEYFGQTIMVILISFVIYKLMSKYLPKINLVLSGGRQL